ncbi:MAG: Rnase Y domain-containing protein, partial [Oscillospiraceae bacterium]
MELKIVVILIIVSAVVFGVLGFVLGQIHRKNVAEAAIGSANQEATRIVNQAVSQAEQKKK